MPEQVLSISFSIPTYEQSEYLLIEQEPWGKDVGVTTVLQALSGIMATIYGTAWPLINCGGLPEGYDTVVYVYPSTQSLAGRYQFKIINGDPPVRTISEFPRRDETIQCGFADSIELKYPPFGFPFLQWIGQCYDINGNITTRPVVEVVGRKVSFSKKVYGSIRANYETIRHAYLVRVEERKDSIEDNFKSVVYCVWDGGVRWLEVDPPSGYDYTQGDCGNGFPPGTDGSTIVNPPDDDDSPPYADEVDRQVIVDYCPQEVIYDSAGILDKEDTEE